MAFLGLTGWALDQAFRESARSAVRERLQTHVYALLAAADFGSDAALLMPDGLPERASPFPPPASTRRFLTRRTELCGVLRQWWDSMRVFACRRAPVRSCSIPPRWTVQSISGSASEWCGSVNPERSRYWCLGWPRVRRVLIAPFEGFVAVYGDGWVGWPRCYWSCNGPSCVWGLAPLRHVAEDLRSIESGERERLEGQYPQEIRRLTDNLNALIARDEGRLERYRNAMADLAHSLKTPLAVIKGIADKDAEPSGDAVQLSEQARRMNQIVEYQLQKASTSGKAGLARAVQPRSLVDKLLATLVKVYADKAVQVTVDIPERTVFHGESGDLMELAGNLLDNAFKCCRGRIAVRIRQVPEGQSSKASRPVGLDLQVDDDGAGIPDDLREMVLQRGVRADEAACGQGIGLAVVREIVEAYEGQLEIGSSEELGGARMSVFLPRG